MAVQQVFGAGEGLHCAAAHSCTDDGRPVPGAHLFIHELAQRGAYGVDAIEREP
jgi:hypothetical protein